MARLSKTETNVNMTGTGAAPVRRKAASTPHKRTLKPAATPADTETTEAPATEAPEVAVEEVIVVAVTPTLPTQEDIAALAYSYWVERGYTAGSPEHDWLRAESELRQRARATQ